VACGLAGLGVLFLPIWDLPTMASGPAVYARRYLARQGPPPEREIIFYRDGPGATVAVEHAGGITSLLVNGKADASTAPTDMTTQLMLGHLPLLLHAAPRAVLVIGFGSGITAGAVARIPWSASTSWRSNRRCWRPPPSSARNTATCWPIREFGSR
jgi:hypothetical protein